MKNKKILIAVCIIALCALALYFCADNIVIAAARRQLKNICKGSIVSIGQCRIKPTHSITLTDLEIKVPAVYDIKIKDLKISYSIYSVIRGNILAFYLGTSSFNVNMSDKDIAQLKQYFNLESKKSALKINEMDISDLALTLKTQDVNFSGKASIGLDLKGNRIKNIDLKLDSLDAQGVLLESGYLKGPPATEGAGFYVQNVKYNDVKINEVSGRILVKDNMAFVKSFTAKLFDGTVNGDASYSIDKNRDFVIDLKVTGFDLSTFVREMKMENKFQMTGRLGGKVALGGNEFTSSQIEGNFSTDSAGGVLIIKDTRFLENMAQESGQSLDILMESFKQYEYNVGSMNLSVDNGNLIFDVALEGASGKRNFKVVLHDFLSKKGCGL